MIPICISKMRLATRTPHLMVIDNKNNWGDVERVQRPASETFCIISCKNWCAIEREVKEKFAPSPFCTSGWWVIFLTRTFSLATNWVSKKKKKVNREKKPIFSTSRLFHKDHLMTQISSSQSLLHACVTGRNYRIILVQIRQTQTSKDMPNRYFNMDLRTNPYITGLSLKPKC